MPCYVLLQPEARVIRKRGHGQVTDDELANASRYALHHHDFEPGFDELWDGSRATDIIVDLKKMRRAVASERRNTPRIGPGRIAVVYNQTVYFALFRLYQVLTSPFTKREFRTFDTVAEAEAWLGVPPVPEDADWAVFDTSKEPHR
ncbi:MAG: hypothetical protein AAF752_13055 [Bacteroidota bacterium]